MAAKRKALSLILLVLAIFAAPAAVAHVRPNQALHPSAIDFRYELPEPSGSEPFAVFTDPKLHLFDDVAGVGLPRPSISTRLEQRIGSIALATTHTSTPIFTRRVSEKLASGLRDSLNRAIVNQLSDLRPKTQWGDDYVRERWYSPETGTFISPDPMGYEDSANLYAFGGGDPVNNRDPRGEAVATTAKGWYVTEGANSRDGVVVSSEWIRANPLAAQDLIHQYGGLSDQETKDWMYGYGLKYTHDYDRAVQRALPPGKPGLANWVKDTLIATSPMPPQNERQQFIQGGIQIAGSLAPIGAGVFARAKINAAMSQQPDVRQPLTYAPPSGPSVGTPVAGLPAAPEETGLELGIRLVLPLPLNRFTPEERDYINRKYGMANMKLASGEETGKVGANEKYSYHASRRFVRDTLYPDKNIDEVTIPDGMNVDEIVPRSIGGRKVRPNQSLSPALLNQTLGGYEGSVLAKLPKGTKVLGFYIQWY